MPHRSVTRKPERQRRRWLGVLTAIVAAAVAMSPLVGTAPAQAASVSDGFQPGNIISDDLFYNGSAMSASDVQSFLNRQVTRCIIGDAGYKPGSLSPSGTGNRIANACLKDFKMTTQSRPADSYCKAYAGAKDETAAQIIAKVGQACGISQRVILIMLEKEQSLVSDTWPVTRQYNYAMGMDCPDSGPGNSANCDESGAGFFQQVLRGTRQLQVYRLNPNSFRYKPYQTNTIQWHPNASCGTSQVKIENQATAALYIYTPYRPNQAALDAGWGTGNSCSTYGNRNFYNFYKSWFGSTSAIAVTGKIKTYWDANKAVMGAPRAAAKKVTANGGGEYQEFANGVIFLDGKTNVVTAMSNGAFLTNYRNAGFVEGKWGLPIEKAMCGLASGGCTMKMTHGTVAYSSKTGSQLIPTELVDAWSKAGGAASKYGYPSSAAEYTPARDGFVQQFQNNMLTWNSKTGARVFEPEFVQPWKSLGGMKIGIGVPTAAMTKVTQNGGGTQLEFTSGTLYKSAKGTFAMQNGGFRNSYTKAGGPAGSWGWPTGKSTCGLVDGGCQMPFQNGVTLWSNATGGMLVSESTLKTWNELKGSIGYPTQAEVKFAENGGGSSQEFSKGTLWTSKHGTFAIGNKALNDAYVKAGGPKSSLGWPAANAGCDLVGGGCQMKFQNGTAMWSSATGIMLVSPETLTAWNASKGSIGYPTKPATKVAANGGGTVQEFSKGTVWSSALGTFAVENGGLRTAYIAAGGPASAFGWPAANSGCGLTGGGCQMKFEGGTGMWSSDTGLVLVSDETFAAWTSAKGVVGYPKKAATQIAENGGGTVQEFTKGTVWSSQAGTFAFQNGDVRTAYVKAGGPKSSFGWPAGTPGCGLTGGGCQAKFQNGTGMWSSKTGLVLVPNEAYATWKSLNGSLGYPSKPATQVADTAKNGGGTVQEFAKGTIWSSAQGSFGMEFGAFRTGYLNAGGTTGSWGWPAGKASCGLVGGGCQMPFQNGIGMWSSGTGMVLVSDDSFKMWNTVKGSIGYPTKAPKKVADTAANGGGEVQEFTRGTVWTSEFGSFAMEFGAFRTGYLNAGGPQGSWGWPAGKASCGLVGGGCQMPFQNGIGMWSPGTGMVLVSDDSFKMWNTVKGSIGYPTKAPTKIAESSANGAGEVQEFTRGTVWTSSAGSFAMEFGAFRTGYLNSGGPQGPWGWPVAKAQCGLAGGACTMQFQNGEVYYKAGKFTLR